MPISLFDTLVVVIFLCTILLAFYQNKTYRLPVWKVILLVVVGAVASGVGIFVLAYVEHGYWSRWSFFGCVFCVPIVYFALAKIIRVPYNVLMDFAGPICALFFALIKINCAVKGCCSGICIYNNANKMFNFPVQIIESLGGAIILILLLSMQKNKSKRGRLAPIFLMMFGLLRFCLSFFRRKIVFLHFLRDVGIYIPATMLWPFLCIIWGYMWMYRIVSKREGRRVSVKEVVAAILDMFRFRNREEVS